MSRLRLAALAVAICCGLMLLGGTGVASAQGPARLSHVVPLTGTAKGGKHFTGKYTIERFIRRGNKVFSSGTVTGRLAGRKVRKKRVRMPAALAPNGAARTALGGHAAQLPLPLPPLPPGNACAILALNLGPVNLNVLGLVVRTNEIQLRIDAVQGAGNLLGNLLCGITGILNPTTLANTPLGQLTQILNALLALSPRTPTPA